MRKVRKHRRMLRVGAVMAVAVMATSLGSVSNAANYSAWGSAQKIDTIDGNSSELNTTWLDGCPIQSPDGLSLYLASNRPRFAGDTRTDLDIWVAHRDSTDAPWGAPVNLGEPVNSTADDFCPTPVRGGGLFFVSREPLPGVCGMGDIYFARLNPSTGWTEPTHLGCEDEGGPNSGLDEQGPSYVEAGGQGLLFFSRSSASVPGNLYVSEQLDGGGFGPAAPVAELNDDRANDIQPNVRKDGREVVFSSNRLGSIGGQDLYVATREHVDDPWSIPVNLGSSVNTTAGETRPSLSWDAQTLVFGRVPGPEGSSDIFVASRQKLGGE